MQRSVRNALARTTGNRHDAPAADVGTALRCLAVCSNVGDAAASELANASPDLTFLPFHQICATSIANLAPDMVLSPLVSEAFDCFDLAHALTGAGFRGRYRAAAAHIPDPGLVRREIRASFPGLDFDIILIRPRGTGPDH